MPRGRGEKRKRGPDDAGPAMNKCNVCGEPHDPRGHAAHQRICRINKRNRDQCAKIPLPGRDLVGRKEIHNGIIGTSPLPSVVDDKPTDIVMSDHDENGPFTDDLDDGVPTVLLPSHYILTVPHPHSGLPATIIPLDRPTLPKTTRTFATGINPSKPFAPFRCYADYDFTSNCVRHAKSKKQIQEELDALHGGKWARSDMEASLDAACATNNTPFERTTICVAFDGETDRFRRVYEVEIDFRDPWKVIQEWQSGAPGRTFDEPWTGYTWQKVDVSTKVKMHPILLRGLWIASSIRNASGNGGSALLGYIIMPPELRNIDMKDLTAPEKEDVSKLKSLIYNEINSVILRSLKARSRYGDTLRFGMAYGKLGILGFSLSPSISRNLQPGWRFAVPWHIFPTRNVLYQNYSFPISLNLLSIKLQITCRQP
ncbi:hypothetical protein B0H14DRAFT_2602673 [Mycena olivaceomarginata]|nr:hypothetical protein B0H14DRAFT_2602673 [Mycena olivaceomarginata]